MRERFDSCSLSIDKRNDSATNGFAGNHVTPATTRKCWLSAVKQHPEASRTRTVRPEEE
jgi:hypothetical protein